mgnify:CR=1 FL=1
MRTTLDIDEDVLQAARDLASLHKVSMGRVLSELARKGLCPEEGRVETRNGVPLLPRRSGEERVDLDLVNRLRDESAAGAESS